MNNKQKAIHERNAQRAMVLNILAVWEVAKADGLDQTDWYRDAFDECLFLADKFDLTIEQVAWIVATLSPHLSWRSNVTSAIAFLSKWLGVESGYSNCAYGKQTHKCELFMLGELDGLPTGRKVNPFYQNLLLNYDAVTIDRHAWRIAQLGTRNLDQESGDGEFGDVDHRVCVRAYREVAEYLGIRPAELQAIIWQVVAREDY